MQIYTHTLPGGAVLTGYLRDENARLQHPLRCADHPRRRI